MFKFEFTEEMTKAIGAALENAPYRIAAPILAEMQRQITAQQAPPPPPQGNGDDSRVPA